MKRFATGLFIAVSVAFLIARVLESRWGDGSWIGFVRATAEAAMVGALADWFAVTALFRHPLGLPIPHTAIIPERKTQIGQGLGECVPANFASGELLAERVTALQPARRVTEWLGKPENAALVGRSATAAVRWTLARLRDEEINAAIERLFVTRARNIDAGPMLGRALETVTGQDRHQDLVTEGLRTAVRLLDTSKGDLWANFVASAPWWIPERVDERVFDRLFVTGRNLLAEAANNTKHPLRRRLDRRIAIFAHELQHDEALINKAADWRDHLIDDPAVRAWVGSLWGDAKQTAVAQLDDSSSTASTMSCAMAPGISPRTMCCETGSTRG